MAERWIAHAPFAYWQLNANDLEHILVALIVVRIAVHQHTRKVWNNSLVRHLRPVERWTIRVVADAVVKLLNKFKHTHTHAHTCVASATERMHGVYTARADAHCVRSVAACTGRSYRQTIFFSYRLTNSVESLPRLSLGVHWEVLVTTKFDHSTFRSTLKSK